MPKTRSPAAGSADILAPAATARAHGRRRVLAAALAVAGLSAIAAVGPASAASILEVADQAALQQAFCAADPTVEHVVVLPAALFVDSEELVCAAGPYKLYRIVEHDDPDDFEYYIDPPFGAKGRLACDGKAGRGMKVVAVNCRPAG